MKLHAVLAIVLLALMGAAAHAADSRPNIIFFLVDDMGYMDVGCNGSKYYITKNIDRLASEGMRFTNGYAACPVCSPTRAALLTGKYPARLNLTDWLPGRADMPSQKMLRPKIVDHLAPEEKTIASVLKDAGYATASIGKWHLGGKMFAPTAYGFDLNFGGTHQGSPPSYWYPYKIENITSGAPGEYLADRLTGEAEKFIEANKDKPFFLYLPHYSVHIPLQGKKEIAAKYQTIPPTTGRENARQSQGHPGYAAMVESLDESLGRIMAKLEQLKIADRTIIVFTSDNGGLSTAEGSPTSNEPLRAGKGHLFEGGIREPMIVKWPGVVKAGSMCDIPVTSTDFFPTFCEISGIKADSNRVCDGVSILPLLKQSGTIEREALYWHYPHYSNQGGPPGGAVRKGDFKLIEFYEDSHVELYNLKDDLSERNDLAEKMPEKTKELRELFHAWLKSVDAKMPTENPKYDPKAKKPEDKVKLD